MEYLGPHECFKMILSEFVKGNLNRDKQPRESYMGQKVIDMSKIRMDFFRNEIRSDTLRCLDHAFFVMVKPTNPEECKENDPEERPAEHDFASLRDRIANKTNAIMRKPVVSTD